MFKVCLHTQILMKISFLTINLRSISKISHNDTINKIQDPGFVRLDPSTDVTLVIPIIW